MRKGNRAGGEERKGKKGGGERRGNRSRNVRMGKGLVKIPFEL